MSQSENFSLAENTPTDPHSTIQQEVNDPSSPEIVSAELAHIEESSNEQANESLQADDSLNEEKSETQEAAAVTEPATDTPKKRKGKKDSTKTPVDPLESLRAELNNAPNADAKLQLAVDSMEKALSQGGTPQFKEFWELRKICLELFKGEISPAIRGTLWAKYSDLSKEARRLKEIFDEQSAFAVEQIEMAIKALEGEIEQFEEHVKKMTPLAFEQPSQFLDKKSNFYLELQTKLNLLNAHASRINTLRKELIRTEMRIRDKNKFFQRLSSLGDKVFPMRKDLIRDVSEGFLGDINLFIDTYFKSETFSEPPFFLREEIKALQGVAKLLTLNTQSFTQTRIHLSECWDKLKVVDKERKKEISQKRELFKVNFDEVAQKIKEFNESYATGEISMGAAMKQLEEISSFMRNVELGREEVKQLRDLLTEAKKPIVDKSKAEEEQRQNEEKERQRQKVEALNSLRTACSDLIKNAENMTAEQLVEERNAVTKRIEEAGLVPREKNEMERLLRPMKDLISEKQEQALMSLSDDDKQNLQTLRDVFKQRKQRRNEIKDQLDKLRKTSGSSGFDFEQAMRANEQINEEKERLEKADKGIEEIEDKIAELRRKVS